MFREHYIIEYLENSGKIIGFYAEKSKLSVLVYRPVLINSFATGQGKPGKVRESKKKGV